MASAKLLCSTSNGVLMHAIETLEEALRSPCAGQERAWAENIGSALEIVAKRLWQRIVMVEETARAEVDDFSGPMIPTLERRLAKLNDEDIDLWEQACTLRKFILDVAQPFSSPIGQVFTGIYQEGRRLADDLRRHEEKKAGLILEDVDTDIGAGD